MGGVGAWVGMGQNQNGIGMGVGSGKNHAEKGGMGEILSASWTNDGQYLALGHYNGHVSIRDKQGAEQVLIERTAPVWTLQWNPSRDELHDVLCVGCWDRTLSFYKLNGMQVGKDREVDFDPCSVAFFSDGEFLCAGGTDKKVEIAYVVGSLSVCPPLVARRCAAGAVVVVTPVAGHNTAVDAIAVAGDLKAVVAASFCLGAAGAGIAPAVLVAAGEVGLHILSFVGCVVDAAVAGPVSAFVVAGVAGATVVAAGSPDVGFGAIVHDAAAVPPEAVAVVAGDALAAVRTAGALVQLGPGGGAPVWAYSGY
ncbi:hypothetical protein CBR_g968 [Chara braunii]|uniref:Anaphase-promoting complex subunit 4 WD40 domain-containing protein n=1 Tax=Chara braunii TaxID=69332 RepID=A0A388KCW3_CHABU|nr:hypothetical protein CBR_g968 [Chara braunii]|eukprot:GBG67847.1 hypothetical protein CBR_g968 [Chara braunii]